MVTTDVLCGACYVWSSGHGNVLFIALYIKVMVMVTFHLLHIIYERWPWYPSLLRRACVIFSV